MSHAFSQGNQGTVKGKVSDETGVLPSATIRVAGTASAISADANGDYLLKLAPGTYTLTSTYLGYTTQVANNVIVTAGKETIVNFKMEGSTQLKEVVVTYGKQKSREVTGSIVTLSSQGLDDMPVNQFAQQLQGKAAGVQVLQSSGQPGRGVEFRIRGAASFNASNQPLFVVDGMPVTGSINNINPSEIESYSILKDAAATALYGSRASNGVVLITTKHAKAGDSKIEFNSNYGLQKIPENKLPRPMNAREFATFMKERWDDGLRYNPAYTVAADYAAAYSNPSQYGEGTNWFKLLTRTAPIQNYDLTIQTARENSSSTLIAGYQEQQGVVLNTGTKLFSLRFNQDISLVNNKLKIGFNVAPSYRLDHNNRLSTDGVGGLFERLFEASPLVAPYDADGNYIRNVSSPGMVAYINPLAIFNLTKDDYKTTRILGNAYLNYEFLKGLSFKANIGVDKGAETNDYFQSGQVTSSANNPTGTSKSADTGSYTAEGYFTYNKSYKDHNFEALAGYSIQEYSGTSNSLTGLGFASEDIPYLSAATSITGTSNYNAYRLLSTIGRLNYSFKGRYLLSAAIRRDGSSRFGANKQFGNFPSVSAGWIVSDESFMKNVKLVDFFKLRASYGLTGNNAFGNYDAQALVGNFYYDFNNVITQGSTINALPNSELRWERNKQFDLGFELSILKNRINITYDYYHKISDGLILPRQIPK
ncbi:MAG: SusC/RagA family TonB-linked outer membrane protein, partial [Pedobacter sp.]|nr:SusC/RagA family TonB-linked outer membrane protein [Pedobacter sp.]